MDGKKTKTDLAILLITSFIFAALYICFEDSVMEYGKNENNPLLYRFLPVLAIQFGMSCLGALIVLIKNQERLSEYGFVRKNTLKSIVGCLLFSVPTVAFLWYFKELHPFLPFRGMFLTKDILHAGFPMNVLGYLIIGLIWGFGEGLYYIVLSKKINILAAPRKLWNPGAFICAVFAVLIHGMVGVDLKTVLEAAATFILMYGSVCLKDKIDNAWGNIVIFFVIWNAL